MGRRNQDHVKGFRPGKEPPQLRQRAAKQQFTDLTPAQERLVTLFSERTPQESRQLITRWLRLSLALTVGLVLLAIAAWLWIPVVGMIVGVTALLAGVIYIRLLTQRGAMEAMADAVARGGGSPGGKRRKR